MGRKNAVTKRFCSEKTRFADLVNGVYFGGKNVIHSKDLRESSESYACPVKDTETEEEGAYLERERDIKMFHTSGSTIRILALENQSHIDYGMPLRCMEYDVLEYRKQIDEMKQQNLQDKCLSTNHEWLCGMKRTDRLWPTYTLCLYLGEEPWDGPRSLRDMMDFGEDADDFKEQFADYPFRLYCVNEEQDFSVFHTQLRNVFELLPLRKDKKRLQEKLSEDDAYSHMDADSLEFLSVVMDNPAIWKNRDKYKRNVIDVNGIVKGKQEEYDMCQAIKELIEDGKQEGIKVGIKRGIEQGIEQGVKLGKLMLIIPMIRDGILAKEDAAKRVGISLEQLEYEMTYNS